MSAHNLPKSSSPFSPILTPVITTISILLLNFIPCALGESFACSTPTSFNRIRFPEIVDVFNACPSHNLSLCMEFSGQVYEIHRLKPRNSHALSTVQSDCWVMRVNNCAGTIILQHNVTASRHLVAGCTAQDTNAQGTAPAFLDCTLTKPPDLDAVFKAASGYLLPAVFSELDTHALTKDDIAHPTEFVVVRDAIISVYHMCLGLSRQGVPSSAAFRLLSHARTLFAHEVRCNSHLVADYGRVIGIPRSYLAVYGSAVALLEAEAKRLGKWIDKPPILTSTQLVVDENHAKAVAEVPLNDDIPSSLLPSDGTRRMIQNVETESSTGQVAALMNALKSTELNTGNRKISTAFGKGISHEKQQEEQEVRRQRQFQDAKLDGMDEWRRQLSARTAAGQAHCDSDGPGKWKFIKVTKGSAVVTDADCCGLGCSEFDRHTTAVPFSTMGFRTHCCLMCNRATRCAPLLSGNTKAVLETAEIQMPFVVDVGRPPRVVMLF